MSIASQNKSSVIVHQHHNINSYCFQCSWFFLSTMACYESGSIIELREHVEIIWLLVSLEPSELFII